ncbi:MAG: DUF2834 domain-containing protein [Gammaproteobacteria bacterium]|nr:DUF2834 domain-containing protein [Gammaproteobacteria bacterium]
MQWLSRFYLGSAVVGALVPGTALAIYFQQSGMSPADFGSALFVNPAAAAVTLDLLLSALLFLVWLGVEGRRVGMRRLWVYVPATLLVGLSFALPLFFYFRARQLARHKGSE